MNKEIEEMACNLYLLFPNHNLGEQDCKNAAEWLISKGWRKQKVGRWVRPSPFSDPICSECKKSPKRVGGMLAPFCPNCGTKMEGDSDER